MAKLVDALPSGGSVRKDVQVRILFWAQKSLYSIYCKGFFVKFKCGSLQPESCIYRFATAAIKIRILPAWFCIQSFKPVCSRGIPA